MSKKRELTKMFKTKHKKEIKKSDMFPKRSQILAKEREAWEVWWVGEYI